MYSKDAVPENPLRLIPVWPFYSSFGIEFSVINWCAAGAAPAVYSYWRRRRRATSVGNRFLSLCRCSLLSAMSQRKKSERERERKEPFVVFRFITQQLINQGRVTPGTWRSVDDTLRERDAVKITFCFFPPFLLLFFSFYSAKKKRNCFLFSLQNGSDSDLMPRYITLYRRNEWTIDMEINEPTVDIDAAQYFLGSIQLILYRSLSRHSDMRAGARVVLTFSG